MPPLVSVVVLNYNGKRWIDVCCPSLLKTTYPNVEWLFVDNASSDDSVAYCARHYPQFRIVRSAANSGYAGGNNLGIRESRGDYVVLLNNDIEVDPEWLSVLVHHAEDDPRIGALQPKIRSMIDAGRFEYAGAAGGFIDRWGYAFLRGRVFDHIESDHGQYDDVREIFWASGAAMFLRRKAVEEAGGLDESYFMHYEEIDLCWRLHWAGYRILSIPQSVVYHYVGASLPPQSFRKMYFNHRNSLVTLIKNLPARRLPWILAVRWCLDGIAALRSLVKEPLRFFAIGKAHFWIYGHLVTLFRRRREAFTRHTISSVAFDHLIYPRSIAIDYFLKKKIEFHTLGIQK